MTATHVRDAVLPDELPVVRALYRSLGFEAVDPCYDNPVCGALFLERWLR